MNEFDEAAEIVSTLTKRVIAEEGHHSNDQNKEPEQSLMPMPPEEGPPLPRRWGIRWPWRE